MWYILQYNQFNYISSRYGFHLRNNQASPSGTLMWIWRGSSQLTQWICYELYARSHSIIRRNSGPYQQEVERHHYRWH